MQTKQSKHKRGLPDPDEYIKAPVLRLLVTLAAVIFISAHLASHVGGNKNALFVTLFQNGLLFVGAIGITSSLAFLFRPWILAAPCGLISLLIALYVLIDGAVVLKFGRHFALFDILTFLPYWNYLFDVGRLWEFAVIAVLLVALVLRTKLSRSGSICFILLAFSSTFVGLLPISLPKAFDNRLLFSYEIQNFAQFWPFETAQSERYTDEDVLQYGPAYWRDRKLELPEGKPNIIFVMVESFSAAYSMRTSGIEDFVPKLDELSKEGILFQNFFANHPNSHGGLISYINGTPPIPFPGNERSLTDDWKIQHTVIHELRKLGYRTEFLMTASIDYYGEYLREAGFEIVRGINEVKHFQDAPRFAFNSPPDSYLYTEALSVIDQAKTKGRLPLFLFLETISTHDYIDPLGREGTAENLWNYADGELAKFYEALKANSFFKDGLLIISADHPVRAFHSKKWHERYGDSVETRIPLYIFGRGVPAGRIDNRFFQQSDLFFKLKAALEGKEQLSPTIIFTGQLDVLNRNSLHVYSEEKGGEKAYTVEMRGRELRWMGETLPEAKEIEARIHGQRVVHQTTLREKENDICLPSADINYLPSREGGVYARFYKGFVPQLNSSAEGIQFLGEGSSRDISIDDMYGKIERWSADLGIEAPQEYTVEFETLLKVDDAGPYWFNSQGHAGYCIYIDGQRVMSRYKFGHNHPEKIIYLSKGLHTLYIQYFGRAPEHYLRLRWIPPNKHDYEPISEGHYIKPLHSRGFYDKSLRPILSNQMELGND